jgi:hypothetical protein
MKVQFLVIIFILQFGFNECFLNEILSKNKLGVDNRLNNLLKPSKLLSNLNRSPILNSTLAEKSRNSIKYSTKKEFY